MTPEEIAALAELGRFWWQTADNTTYATTDRIPASPADVYLIDASPAWVAQWEGNWQRASDQINAALAASQQQET